jgi:predicted nucleotidyltransferase
MRNAATGDSGPIPTLEQLFGTRARVRLLRRLSQESQSLTARQLAELVGLNHRAVVEALDPLRQSGVVERRHVGPSYLYTLNRESHLAQALVLPLFEEEKRSEPAFREDIVSLFPGAVSVVLFGSLARGEAGPGSDVDVLVVMDTRQTCAALEDRADEASHSFFRRWGHPLSVHCVTRAELGRAAKPFLAEAIREGQTLAGIPLEAMRRPNG